MWRDTNVHHPLDPLTKDEILQCSEIVKKDCKEHPDLRFETIELYEPTKSSVKAFDKDPSVGVGERKARASIFYVGKGIGVWKIVINLSDGKVLSKEERPNARPMIQLDEFTEIEKVVQQDERVIAACAKPNGALPT